MQNQEQSQYQLHMTTLPKTWLIDLDGTILKHNGYKENEEKLLPGVKDFWKNQIHKKDTVIIITARSKDLKNETCLFLQENGLSYNQIIFDIPVGERILINDRKDSGLKTAYAVNLNRNRGLQDIILNLDPTK